MAHATPGQEQPADDRGHRRQQVEKWQKFDIAYRHRDYRIGQCVRGKCGSYCEDEQKRLPPSLSPWHQKPQYEDDVAHAKKWIDDSPMPLDQPWCQRQPVIPDVNRWVEQPCDWFFVEAAWALCRPFRRADPHRQRKCVEVHLLDPSGGTDKVGSTIEQEQRDPIAFEKASAPRPNFGELVLLATIQRHDVLEGGAVEAPSGERDRYAGDDLLLIARLQYFDADICRRLEANVLEAPPTQREQAQRIERAKRRGKHRDDDPRTSDLKTAPPGAPQAQHLIILDPLVVSAGDGNRPDFGGRAVEDERQDVKRDQQEASEGERNAHYKIGELRPFMENLLDNDHRHDRGGGDGQPPEHVAINRYQRCPRRLMLR